MQLWVTQISLYMRCESHNAVSIAPTVFIISPLEVENIELLRQHRLMLCRDSQSVLRFSRNQWHLGSTNVVGICRTDTKSDMPVKTIIAMCEYNGTPTAWFNTPRDYLMNMVTKDAVLLNLSGTSTTDTVQTWWQNWPWLMIENDKPLFLLTLLANVNCGWHGAGRHNLPDFGWFY